MGGSQRIEPNFLVNHPPSIKNPNVDRSFELRTSNFIRIIRISTFEFPPCLTLLSIPALVAVAVGAAAVVVV